MSRLLRHLARLFGPDDGPPPVTLPSPKREPLRDDALNIPPDPTRSLDSVTRRREWVCPAMAGKGKKARPCGRPKAPEKTTCGRRACRSWASRQAAKQERRRATVLGWRG